MRSLIVLGNVHLNDRVTFNKCISDHLTTLALPVTFIAYVDFLRLKSLVWPIQMTTMPKIKSRVKALRFNFVQFI